MRVSARSDYAVRATMELARVNVPVKCPVIARRQDIPLKFLINILTDLRRSGLVCSRRGVDGGYWLARPPAEITLGDILRAIDGPLTTVAGMPADAVEYSGEVGGLADAWRRLRKGVDDVVDGITVSELVSTGTRCSDPVR
ncbi:RrF2 family transcriptional regulator [Prauserella cavernicola]|uniref:Rrf2 family transcriptional regulator n=1 Tax=Prauserella cavernicola TaxID=2800127 RepID=A0A934QNF9_9PSEU|nr:Rrf2 family transcriptional regulator [Prauserella cavernicola]MBK1783710.1 Rrf2 family transcriptional regulator [Prauserella cavernicola]